mgnify:CR=1 FL=1
MCKGRDDEHWDVLNLIFRIIYPCVCTAVALLFARYLPDALLPNLAVVHGLNRRPPAVSKPAAGIGVRAKAWEPGYAFR